MTDDDFLAAVERAARGIPTDGFRFGHREHLRLAWLQPGDVVAATIRRVDAAHGGGHYHETITRFWLGLVRYAHERHPGTSFDALLAEHPGLLDGGLPRRHYSEQVLSSGAARGGYVSPDLAPVPWDARPAV